MLNIIRLIARISSAIVAALLIFFLAAYLIGKNESFGKFNSTVEMFTFLLFPVSTVIGIFIAWKKELIGGIISTFGFVLLFFMRTDLLRSPYLIACTLPGLLFLWYGLIRHTKLIKLLAIIFLCPVILSSCEKVTYFDYTIYNLSSSSLAVNGTDIIHAVNISLTVDVQEKKYLSTWKKNGIQTSYFEPTAILGNDLIIINARGDTLRKDYKQITNWQTSVDNQGSTASHQYIFTVTDNDF